MTAYPIHDELFMQIRKFFNLPETACNNLYFCDAKTQYDGGNCLYFAFDQACQLSLLPDLYALLAQSPSINRNRFKEILWTNIYPSLIRNLQRFSGISEYLAFNNRKKYFLFGERRNPQACITPVSYRGELNLSGYAKAHKKTQTVFPGRQRDVNDSIVHKKEKIRAKADALHSGINKEDRREILLNTQMGKRFFASENPRDILSALPENMEDMQFAGAGDGAGASSSGT